jgi:hypothetical protein
MASDNTGKTPNTKRTPDAAAWAAKARELARWAQDRYIIRTDVWGGYIPMADRGKELQRPDGTRYKLGTTCTRPARSRRGQVSLTTAILERHFRGRGVEHIVGAHTTSLDNLSRFGTVEVDHHGPESNSPDKNLKAALGWYDALRQRGFHPLLWDSNGAGGYHLDILLREPAPTPRLYWFLFNLVSDHASRGLPARPETFPKQPRLDPRPDGRGSYGNWVRLPGRHHTRDHWATVWDGSRWLAGAEAVSFILSLTGDPADLLPEEPPAPHPPPTFRPRVLTGRAGKDNLSARIAAYMARLPNLAEGQGRDDVAFNAACWLVRDMALADDEALVWLERWDMANNPPKGRERLAEILGDAHTYGRHAYGSGLTVTPGPTRRNGRHRRTILTATVEVRS